MGLKAVLDADAWGELDESVQSFYVEAKGGKYVLDAEGVDDLPQIQGLKSTLDKYKKVDSDANRLRRRMEALGRWEEFEDADPDDVREKLQRLEEIEARGKEGGGGGEGEDGEKLKTVYENRMAALADRHSKELAKLQTEIQDRDGFIERLLVDNRLDAELGPGGAVDERGVIPTLKKAAKAQLRQDYKFRVIREDGEYRAIVETDMGEQDIETFLDSWGRSDEADPFIPASGNSGSGASAGKGMGGGKENPWSTGNLTEQGRITRDNPQLARTLAIQAGKPPPKIAA